MCIRDRVSTQSTGFLFLFYHHFNMPHVPADKANRVLGQSFEPRLQKEYLDKILKSKLKVSRDQKHYIIHDGHMSAPHQSQGVGESLPFRIQSRIGLPGWFRFTSFIVFPGVAVPVFAVWLNQWLAGKL
eukprot:TRINITY_DN361_c0_g2_i2.p1 TRINITY_DN361_c0_g2~~TRINITY_DN361_c0_g2_i2.p1  ORF type:complete len:129 (-),score=36.69 TRINITY_DN361_c0_g2_i2:108-494(-)